ncbi:two-component system response regulator CreB, partial [Pseudomonas aeruginosa]
MRHRSGIPVSRRHTMPHILIVEDEAAIADTLLYALQAEGF